MPTFINIVAAIDFSETSLAAARTAANMARDADGRVHVLHVVPNVFEAPWIVHSPAVAYTNLQRKLIEEAGRQLADLVAKEPFRSAHATCEVASGSAPDAIVRYAVKHAADLIVMGAHGYGTPTRFLLGHVAERVIRSAPCAVLTLPHESLRRADTETAAELAGAGVAASPSRIDPASTKGDEQC
jgi:nucleotide-binding universal stress UspA family protein